jgi:hypothetical protein
MAGDPAPYSARTGLDAARDAALTWAADARLVYLENDEDVALNGSATRWGYLFHSADKGRARGYSVRDGKILEAADLGFDFEAPPLPENWVDSSDALIAAEKKAGRKYREESGGHLANMLLIRGAFYDKKPDTTTWALVYKAENQPTLFVVVDATEGKVVRTWRG